MTRQIRGWLLVAGQFLLIGWLVVAPGGSSGNPWGWSLVIAGVGFALYSAVGLGPALTATPVPKSAGDLVTSGGYRWVRHPVYSGLLLAGLGWIWLGPSTVRGVAWICLLAWFLLKAGFEEKLLAERYPGYPAYAARTGKFIPRLRR